MGRFNISVAVGVCLALGVFSAALADPFSDGADSYDRGDYVTARTDLTPLAEKGDPRAATYLAVIYYHGLGAPKDVNAAFKWATQGAEGRSLLAENLLGALYLSGQGVKQDPNRAAIWFVSAAYKGFAEAQLNLANMYERGQIKPRLDWSAPDRDLGVAWLKSAAWLGQPNAQYKLGKRYLEGTGIPRDLAATYMWFSLAKSAFATDHDAVNLKQVDQELASVSSALSPEQISEVQDRLKVWAPINSNKIAIKSQLGVISKFPKYHGLSCGPAGPYGRDRACREGVSGVALIDCAVASDGTLDGCEQASETPLGYGFGQAALEMALAGVLTTAPIIVNGAAVPDQVRRIEVRFPFTGYLH